MKKISALICFQDILSQTTSSFDELVHTSYREACEHTAAAALTELGNNNHQVKLAAHMTTASTNPIVTSILSKNHIDHLEANSVSVIPIDATNVTNMSNVSNVAATHKTNRVSIKKAPNATATNIKSRPTDSNSPSALEMHRLTQLQQHLETAAVLMDISKKVIISPPSSNPQSPSVSEHVPSTMKSSRMPLKRSGNAEEMDLSTKRSKSVVKKVYLHGKSNHGNNPYQIDNYSSQALKSVIIKNEPVFKDDVENDDMNGNNQYDSDIDSNDSDPDRLQMDISSSQEVDDANAGRRTTSPVKMVYKHNRSQNNKHHVTIDSGRETPESNKSDDHRTDPATTQLWQALARTTGMFYPFFLFFFHFYKHSFIFWQYILVNYDEENILEEDQFVSLLLDDGENSFVVCRAQCYVFDVSLQLMAAEMRQLNF